MRDTAAEGMFEVLSQKMGLVAQRAKTYKAEQ